MEKHKKIEGMQSIPKKEEKKEEKEFKLLPFPKEEEKFKSIGKGFALVIFKENLNP